MRTATVVSLLVLGAAWWLVTPALARGEERNDMVTKPFLVLTGADSRVEKSAYQRVNSEDAFRKLWLSHLGKTEADSYREPVPALSIDFERCMVIAIFHCEKGHSRGLEVVSVTEGNERITL